MGAAPRQQKVYDHRLRELVRKSGDVAFAVALGVPRSTAAGWLTAPACPVVSHEIFDLTDVQVRSRILKLERRTKVLMAIMVLLLALLRVSRFRLEDERLPDREAKKLLLRAVGRAQGALRLHAILRIIGLSSTRFHAWTRKDCALDDRSTCPRSHPRQLAPDEIRTMRDMTTAPEYRHVPTGPLAVLAQRLGRVFVSPSTWSRYVRERGWRRPRVRIHPAQPKEGLRAEAPNGIWHIDVTVFRLLDGTRGYLQAVIDNYSRRILAWRLGPTLDPAATATLLVTAAEAIGRRPGDGRELQSVMVDGGVENFNKAVDELVGGGVLKRILAQTTLRFSNSMIEAFWRSLKHQWCFLNTIDTLTTLRRLVTFYVDQYNTTIPHSAFRGQTPDEMYFGTGADVPDKLAAARAAARRNRVESNRKLTCETCTAAPVAEPLAAAA